MKCKMVERNKLSHIWKSNHKLFPFLQAPEVSKFSQEFRKFFGERNEIGVPQRMT